MALPKAKSARERLGGFAPKLVDLTEKVVFGDVCWPTAMSAATLAQDVLADA